MKSVFINIVFAVLSCLLLRCNSLPDSDVNTITYFKPNYDSIGVVITKDTVSFELDNEILPKSSSFNLKEFKNCSLISFTDNLSGYIVIYDWNTRKIIKKIKPRILSKVLYTYFQNFDSIYVTDGFRFFRIDSSGKQLDSLNLLKSSEPFPTQVFIINSAPLVPKDSFIYVSAFPELPADRLSEMKRWQVLCRINLFKQRASLVQNLPAVYADKLFGPGFLFPQFCYNSKQQFVFSYAADPNIYISDFKTKEEIYSGQSSFLPDTIESLQSLRMLESGEKSTKSFLLRDSYGPIYFDPYNKRYLRVAEKKLNRQDYLNKNWVKEKSLIVFDEKLRIIGESIIDPDINLNTLFICSSGIYARTYSDKNEDFLNFIKLKYIQL